MSDQERILQLFLKLQSGAALSKKQVAAEFGVSEKTIQRDFSFLSEFLQTQALVAAELVYNPKDHTRYLKGHSRFNKKDILIISKILLENRALNTAENKELLQRLLDMLPREEKSEISVIIGSEWLNYAPLTDQQDRIDKVWELSEMIRTEQMLEITYRAPNRTEDKLHTIFPLSLYYDSHYFYMVAFHLKHENYVTFKLDRIKTWQVSTAKKPSLSYGKKFRDGDVRNQRVDAFLGDPMKIEILFSYDPAIVLDQFPTAKLLSMENGKAKLSFTSQDTPGLKRWLLSWGSALRVLSPHRLVEDIKESLDEMKKCYQKD
ncbi:WYL domain-containing transcriptional regulator [Streptococcus pneumoniae]